MKGKEMGGGRVGRDRGRRVGRDQGRRGEDGKWERRAHGAQPEAKCELMIIPGASVGSISAFQRRRAHLRKHDGQSGQDMRPRISRPLPPVHHSQRSNARRKPGASVSADLGHTSPPFLRAKTPSNPLHRRIATTAAVHRRPLPFLPARRHLGQGQPSPRQHRGLLLEDALVRYPTRPCPPPRISSLAKRNAQKTPHTFRPDIVRVPHARNVGVERLEYLGRHAHGLGDFFVDDYL
ncbi:hypothetical protein B0H16DRAFT_494710 [Mycena metata]|uniref:Uncharacterized protein n=1 Tax=Mycena metata TaxID=1033252 RepID=A0AAD7NJW5_9AGAR|nr:hypothetical protein B0H16DRAFT_494710 [Mycena metata]